MANCHFWGEKNFDWVGLDEAGDIIRTICLKYGRLGAHVKEKYGTLRVSAWFWTGDLHGLIYPGYVYCQYKNKWLGLGNILWWMDVYVFPRIAKYTGILFLWRKWQMKVYNHAYQVALEKFPHLREEILVDCDFWEIVDGAAEVHKKYWQSVGGE